MAAGLGFKDFTTGEVLTAADVDGYLMQGIWVFADSAARDAAVTLPQEGNFAFLKDTNTTTYYTGSAWTNLDTTGMVNPMTTTGDTIYSSSGSTPARLGIGSTGQVLTVAGGVPSWAAPAGGGANWTLLNSGGTSLSGASTTVSGISSVDKIMVLIVGASNNSNGDTCLVRFNSDSGANYGQAGSELAYGNTYAAADFTTYTDLTGTSIAIGKMSNNSASVVNGYVMITGCNSSGLKVFNSYGMASPGGGTGQRSYQLGGFYNSASTISSVTILYSGGTFDAGTVYVYTSA